jgi:hypothetical protein
VNTAGEDVTDADVRLAVTATYAYSSYSFRHHLCLCRLTIDLQMKGKRTVKNNSAVDYVKEQLHK